jgi:hypothetical protein
MVEGIRSRFGRFRAKAGDKILAVAGMTYEKAAPKVKEAYSNVAKMAKNEDIDFHVEQIHKAIDTRDKELYDMHVKMLKFRLKDLGLWKQAGRRELNKLRRKMRI